MAEEVQTKPSCFVIQSFDGDTYDRRYQETIKPLSLVLTTLLKLYFGVGGTLTHVGKKNGNIR